MMAKPADIGSPRAKTIMVQNIQVPEPEPDSSKNGNKLAVNDSAIGSWASSRPRSITSPSFDFKYENGRRYHAFHGCEYHLPNDEEEQDR